MASFYNPKLEPTLPVAFFAAAYRFGHSLSQAVDESVTQEVENCSDLKMMNNLMNQN